MRLSKFHFREQELNCICPLNVSQKVTVAQMNSPMVRSSTCRRSYHYRLDKEKYLKRANCFEISLPTIDREI